MNNSFEVVRGSGNVFRDFDRPNADAEQLKAILAAQIIKVLDSRDLSVRQAETATGVPAADFSRIRNAKLDRFTIDRLMNVLDRFNQRVQVSVSFKTRAMRGRSPKARGASARASAMRT